MIVKSAHSNPCFCSKQLKDFGGKNKQQKVKMCVTNYFVISWTESIKWINVCEDRNQDTLGKGDVKNMENEAGDEKGGIKINNDELEGGKTLKARVD